MHDCTVENLKAKEPDKDTDTETDTDTDTDTEKEKETDTVRTGAQPAAPQKEPPRPRPQSSFQIPDVEAVRAYCTERGNSVSPQRFVDYYTANGWMIGNTPMQDWKAAVRRWEQNGADRRPQRGGSGQTPTANACSIDMDAAMKLVNNFGAWQGEASPESSPG